MIERDGPSAVDAYFDRIEKLSGIHAFLIDERGAEVSGEALPAGTMELVQRAREKQGLVNDLTRQVPLNAVAARSPGGALYVLVAEDPAFRRGRFGIPGPGFRFNLFAITRYLAAGAAGRRRLLLLVGQVSFDADGGTAKCCSGAV